MAWLPFSIAERRYRRPARDAELATAWGHLQERLTAAQQLVVSTPFNRTRWTTRRECAT